eukprot:gene19785-biopygen16076
MCARRSQIWARRSQICAPAVSDVRPGARPTARPEARPGRVPGRVPWGGRVHHSTTERSERGECFTRTPPTPPHSEARPVARPVARPAARPEACPVARPAARPEARPVGRPGPSLDERAERARRVLCPHPTNPAASRGASRGACRGRPVARPGPS